MWLAHALTLSRIPLALGLWWAWGDRWVMLALIAAAAASDAADGNVARWMQRRGRTEPAIGAWLDPLVDKLYVAIVLGAIWWHTREIGVLALVAAREVLLLPLMIAFFVRRLPASEIRADRLGKAATIAQFFALGLIVADSAWALAVAALAAGLGVASVVHYVIRTAAGASRYHHPHSRPMGTPARMP